MTDTVRERAERWLSEVGTRPFDNQRENEAAALFRDLVERVAVLAQSEAHWARVADVLACDVDDGRGVGPHSTTDVVPRSDGAVVARFGTSAVVGPRLEVQRIAAEVEDKCARLANEEHARTTGPLPCVGPPEGYEPEVSQ